MAPDRERKTLTGHTGRATDRGFGFGCGFLLALFGLPFAAGGLSLVLSAAGILPGGVQDAPRVIGGFGGGALLLMGVGLLAAAVRGIIRRRREEERQRRLRPGTREEPWLLDHPWDREAARAETGISTLLALYFFALFCFFLAPIHWAVLAGKVPWWLAYPFLGPCDLVLVTIVGLGIRRWLRRRKYGDLSLRFDHFPFFLGERLEARLVVPRLPPEVHSITFTLRCVEERLEQVQPRKAGHGGGGPRVLCDQLYGDVEMLAAPARDPWGAVKVPVSFPLPEGDFSTRLGQEHPRYWELEARAAARGLDLRAFFLVPVYSRSRAPSALAGRRAP